MRESSRANYQSGESVEHINCGSLQRIADAVERMSQNYLALQERAEKYERFYRKEVAQNAHLHRAIFAYKGLLKKKTQTK